MSAAEDLVRARTLVELDRDVEARELLVRMLAADGEQPEALCLLAQAQLGAGESAAALHAAEAAARLEPGSEWPLRLAALAHSNLGHYPESLHYADLAVRSEPDGWRSHLTRARVDLRAGVATAATITAADQALTLAPHEPAAHHVVGNVALATGRPREAEAALRRALALDPGFAAARNDLARVDLHRRQLGRAARGFADAAALDLSDTVAAHNLVVVGAQALRFLHLALWVSLIVADLLGAGRVDAGRMPALAGAGLATLAVAALWFRLWSGARPRTLRLARLALAGDRALGLWCLCLVVVYLSLVAAAVGTRESAAAFVGVGFLALLVGMVSSIAHGRRRR